MGKENEFDICDEALKIVTLKEMKWLQELYCKAVITNEQDDIKKLSNELLRVFRNDKDDRED